MASPKLSKHAGIPQFDIVLLGTGDDGHCASINPHSVEVKDTSDKLVLPIAASGACESLKPKFCPIGQRFYFYPLVCSFIP